LPRIKLFLIATAFAAVACSGPSSPLQPGDRAPDFRADDLTGRTIYLNAELSRPVLLTFYATWCVPCRDEVPLLIDLHERLGEKVRVLCVVADPENKDKVRSFASSLSIPYPLLMDKEQRIMAAYKVKKLPASFLIGTDGRIHSVFNALGTDELPALEEAIGRCERNQ